MLKGSPEFKEMIAKIGYSEPIFILRSQDLLAPTIVACWCEMGILNKMSNFKVTEADEIAMEMKIWQTNHPEHTKIPD